MKASSIATALLVAVKSVWQRGSPFAAFSALWPTDDEGKYVIEAEGIRLALTSHGVAPANLWLNNTHGEEIDIIMGLDHADDYPALKYNPYLNGVIGRYAGLMSGAGYHDEDGKRVQFKANGPNGTLLNGGERGWGRQKWDVAVHTKDSLTLVLFDRSWNGFPGIAASCLTHTVTPYEWHVAWGVTPLITPAPIALSQTVYFNLDGFRVDEAGIAAGNSTSRSSGTVLDHELQLPSSGMRFEVNEHGVPTGGFRPNAQYGPHDFWSSSEPFPGPLPPGARTIRDGVSAQESRVTPPVGYDETFIISHPDTGNKHSAPAAILSSPHSGISVSIFTDRDALRVHTWNEEDGRWNTQALVRSIRAYDLRE